MTKTEKTILDRIRAANDAGEAGNDYLLVGRTKGKRYGRFGRRGSGEPKKAEVAALRRLAESGAVEVRHGSYYVADHPLLASTVVSVERLARTIAEKRAELAAAEELYASELAFAQRWWGK